MGICLTKEKDGKLFSAIFFFFEIGSGADPLHPATGAAGGRR